MINDIQSAAKDGHGLGLIYVAGLAAIVANMMPTPADALYFKEQSVIKDKLENGTITPREYWIRDVAGYYLYTAGWYALLLLTVSMIKGDFQSKARVAFVLIGAGIIVGVVAKNIQKDEQNENYKQDGQA